MGGADAVVKAPERPVAPSPVRVLDLFAGAGGLTAGMHAAGPSRVQVVRAVEADTAAAASYAANFGPVVYRGLIEHWLREEAVPHADIVVGGPPCQGFSTLGLRRSDDERNSLWGSYVEAVARSKPLFFVLENVPQFATSDQFPLLEEQTAKGGVLADYALEKLILNAADFGASQHRKRVVIIGHHRDVRAPGFPKPTHESGSWLTVRDAWQGLGKISPETRPPTRRGVFQGSEFGGPYQVRELHLMRNYRPISLERFAAIPEGGSRRDLPEQLQMDCWRRHKTGSMDVMGRLSMDRPSVTIRTEFTKPEKGRYLHPYEDRAISIAEGARLQGFDYDFRFMGSLTQITKQVGNAVPVPLAKALGRHLLSFIS